MGDEKNARVIAIGNQKGGVGKSTLTVHLAAALGEMGRRCLVWDLDAHRGASSLLGIPKELPVLGSYEVLMGDEEPRDVVISSGEIEGLKDFPKNVSLLAARRNLETIDKDLERRMRFSSAKDVLVPLIDSLRPDFDYIFLDTAPNINLPTVAAYKATNYFLLSAFPEPLAIEGLATALEDISLVRQQGNPDLRLIGVVLSAIKGRRTRLQKRLLKYVDDQFDSAPDPFVRSYRTTIAESTKVCEAQDQKLTMFEMFPHHPITEQYRGVAREVEQRIQAIETGQPFPQPEADLPTVTEAPLLTEAPVTEEAHG